MHRSLILILATALSGCATNSVYFKSEGEKAINRERLRISAPSLYGATRQDVEWIKQAATSKSEFSSMFIIALPFLLADLPVSSISDSLALLRPATWKNHNRRDRGLSRGGPYVIYINDAYNPVFNSSREFEEFFKRLQRNGDKSMSGLTSELWPHGFICDAPCDFYKPRTYRRYAEMENCVQEQQIYVKREWYSEIEYELAMKSTCH